MILGLERHAEVVIEVRAETTNRKECANPCVHAARIELRHGRARDRHERHIVVLEVRQQAFEVVDSQRAAHALQRLPRPLHDVLHEELGAAAKQIREANTSLG